MWERSSSSSSAFICERWKIVAMRKRSESRSFILPPDAGLVLTNPALRRLRSKRRGDGGYEPIPVVGLLAQTLAARGGEFVELGTAIVLGRAPVGLQQCLTDQAKQTGIECALFDQQRIARDLSDGQKDPRPMQRAEGNGPQNEEVESARKKLSLVGHDDPPKIVRRIEQSLLSCQGETSNHRKRRATPRR